MGLGDAPFWGTIAEPGPGGASRIENCDSVYPTGGPQSESSSRATAGPLRRQLQVTN